MSPQEAAAIARRHVDGLVAPPVGIAWRYTTGRRVPGGWFFFYGIEILSDGADDGLGLAGPPGFLVSDDGRVTVVGLGDARSVLGTGRPRRR